MVTYTALTILLFCIALTCSIRAAVLLRRFTRLPRPDCDLIEAIGFAFVAAIVLIGAVAVMVRNAI